MENLNIEQMPFRIDLLQAVRDETGESYEAIAARAGLSSNAVWCAINGKGETAASTVKALFIAMGIDPKHAMNFRLSKSEIRRVVAKAAR